MIAIIPHVRNIPCLDRASSVTNSLDKYHSNAARRERGGERGDTRSAIDKICSEVKVRFYFVPGADRGGS